MWSLFMDSSVTAFNIVLLKDGVPIDKLSRQSAQNMAEFAVGEMNAMMLRNKVGYEQLSDIYVTTGPGSFTSLRIALVIAKTIIAKYRRIALWSASSLAFQLGGREGFSLINARSNSWYVASRIDGIYKQHESTLSEEEWQGLAAQHPELPVWKDLSEDGLLDNIAERLRLFVKSDDYKDVVATYIKPAYGK